MMTMVHRSAQVRRVDISRTAVNENSFTRSSRCMR